MTTARGHIRRAVAAFGAAILLGVAAFSFAAAPVAQAAKKEKAQAEKPAKPEKKHPAKPEKGQARDAGNGEAKNAEATDGEATDREATDGEARQGGKIRLDRDTGLVSGEAEKGALVVETLERLCKLAAIDIEVRGDPGAFDDAVSFEGLKVEAALLKAAAGNSLLVTYAPPQADAAAGDQTRDLAIVSVVLIGADGAGPRAGGKASPDERKTKDRADSTWQTARGEQAAAQPDPRTQQATAKRDVTALAQSGDKEAIRELRERATKAEAPEVRSSALSALAGVAGKESFTLFSTALRDRDAVVRIEAARSLMRVDKARGRPLVEAAARRETNPSVRETMQQLAGGEAVGRDEKALATGLPR